MFRAHLVAQLYGPSQGSPLTADHQCLLVDGPGRSVFAAPVGSRPACCIITHGLLRTGTQPWLRPCLALGQAKLFACPVRKLL